MKSQYIVSQQRARATNVEKSGTETRSGNSFSGLASTWIEDLGKSRCDFEFIAILLFKNHISETKIHWEKGKGQMVYRSS